MTPEEKKNGKEKIRGLVDQLREYHRSEFGLPVGEDGRLEPRSYIGQDNAFPKEKVISDIVQANRKRIQYTEHQSREREENTDVYLLSEWLEKLVPVIITKAVPERFVAVRTTEYDDIMNGVDNIILDRNTGGILCAIDECATSIDQGYHGVKKQGKIGRSASLEYGLKMAEDKVVPKKYNEQSIPLLVISFERGELVDFVTNTLGSSLEKMSEGERAIYQKIIDTMHGQLLRILRKEAEEIKREKEDVEDLMPSVRKRVLEENRERRQNLKNIWGIFQEINPTFLDRMRGGNTV